MELLVYLAGEIHSNWRDEIKTKAKEKGMSLIFKGPNENHDLSDRIGEDILGVQPNAVFKDEAASSINNMRTELWMKKADMVIALFGENYKQWNTAMDASAAVTLGKPLILIRPEKLHHPLKELSRKANVTVTSVDQAIQILEYILD